VALIAACGTVLTGAVVPYAIKQAEWEREEKFKAAVVQAADSKQEIERLTKLANQNYNVATKAQHELEEANANFTKANSEIESLKRELQNERTMRTPFANNYEPIALDSGPKHEKRKTANSDRSGSKQPKSGETSILSKYAVFNVTYFDPIKRCLTTMSPECQEPVLDLFVVTETKNSVFTTFSWSPKTDVHCTCSGFGQSKK
jgi:hypothetical protein